MNKQKILLLFGVALCLAACICAAACISGTGSSGDAAGNDGKVLVVYHSLTGSTKQVAGLIAEKTGGDLYEITIDRKHPTDPDAIAAVVTKEYETGSFPNITSPIPDFSGYDTVFIGGPVWYYRISTPLHSFLEVSDFDGATVVPFTTYDGSYGRYFEEFGGLAKNATVKDGIGFAHVPRESPSSLDKKVSDWLASLNLS